MEQGFFQENNFRVFNIMKQSIVYKIEIADSNVLSCYYKNNNLIIVNSWSENLLNF